MAMRKLPVWMALALIAGNGLWAQSQEAPAAENQPAASASAISYTQFRSPEKIKYFSLEHRTLEAMDTADREILNRRRKGLIIAAEIYGYDITSGNWTVDQAICPEFPGTVLLHYLEKFPDGKESLFTALIPREGGGRIRVVPVLYRNASPYRPATKNPANYALFNELVPADVAKKDAGPGGNWLSLGVCYAEMVGGRPNVPDEPDLDVATIKAPVAAVRLDAVTGQTQIQFSDRDAQKVYTIWTISFDGKGRVTDAMNEDYATYVARIVQVPEPQATKMPTPAQPVPKITPALPEPPAKVTPVPPGS